MKIYKEAGRRFLLHLYDSSSDLFPADTLAGMALRVYERWQTDDAGGEVLDRVELSHGREVEPLVTAVWMRGSPERVPVEMVLALAAEVAGRWIVDGWHSMDRARRPWDRWAEIRGENHAEPTRRLGEMLGMLKEEFVRWGGEEWAVATLDGVGEAMQKIFRGDRLYQ